MTAFDEAVAEVYRGLDRRPPSLWWSKAEIVLGLAAVTVGLMFLEAQEYATTFGPALMTIGGYMALAGHRSHVYDAMTRQTAVILLLTRWPMSSAGKCENKRVAFYDRGFKDIPRSRRTRRRDSRDDGRMRSG